MKMLFVATLALAVLGFASLAPGTAQGPPGLQKAVPAAVTALVAPVAIECVYAAPSLYETGFVTSRPARAVVAAKAGKEVSALGVRSIRASLNLDTAMFPNRPLLNT